MASGMAYFHPSHVRAARRSLGVLGVGLAPAEAQDRGGTYSSQELVRTGHKFFGTVSGGLATVIEEAVARYGQPNGYILGQEGSGAFVGGLRYGEGQLNTRDRGTRKVYWQGLMHT